MDTAGVVSGNPRRVLRVLPLHRGQAGHAATVGTADVPALALRPGRGAAASPDGLTVDTFDGAAWVGLVPFFMRAHTPGDRGAPWASNFCETNVRTYAIDRDGRPGIWFLSLDAARLGAVAVARASYRLPYFWSSMRITGPACAGLTGRASGNRLLMPAPAPGAAHGDQPGTGPGRCSVPARRARGPGPFPDRPVGAVQRAGRTRAVRPRGAPAVAAAPRGGADRGRRPDQRGGSACTPR